MTDNFSGASRLIHTLMHIMPPVTLLVFIVALAAATHHVLTTPVRIPHPGLQRLPPPHDATAMQVIAEAIRSHVTAESNPSAMNAAHQLIHDHQAILHWQLWQDGKRLAQATLPPGASIEATALPEPLAADQAQEAALMMEWVYDVSVIDMFGLSIGQFLREYWPPLRFQSLWMECRGTVGVYSPTDRAVKAHAKAQDVLDAASERVNCAQGELKSNIIALGYGKTMQWFQPQAGAVPQAWSGNEPVRPLEDVSAARLQAFMRESQQWYHTHQAASGALPYLYFPLTDRFSDHNTQTRQWYASLSLGMMLEKTLDNDELRRIYLRHLDHLLDRPTPFAAEPNGFAYLSANSIAAQSLWIAQRFDERYLPAYLETLAFIQLHVQKYHFTTHYDLRTKQSEDKDWQFAPMAAIVALAQAQSSGFVAFEATQWRRLFDIYFKRWQNAPNLYAAPHHARAYLTLARVDPDHANDYLRAALQVANYASHCQLHHFPHSPELVGAFSLPHCQNASESPVSAATRSEALIAGWVAARNLKDELTVKRLEKAIQLAHRYALQGQVQEDQLFYFPNPQRALYGMRGDLDTHTMRIDGIAHTIIAFEFARREGLYD